MDLTDTKAALDFVVVKTHKNVSSHGGLASSQRNNGIKLRHYDDLKKRSHGSQIVVKPLWVQPKTGTRHQPSD